ncbi:heterokaryon incompatibility protein-domain-containing protein [Apiospora arundinis]|uniref:Heterokaryon incompatibility protein-domain-containing protein n=1 Tax=Apiospora arundinis TaxID=335852 RepID=A0ABR2HYD0_9PEZI
MAESPYQPLNHETREIRLFDLFPGKEGDPLTGRLRVVSLDRKPRYDALSYLWGSPEPRSVISLEGGYPLSASPNLCLALSDLRCKRRLRTLWIDALCINQQDDEEKSQQVLLMSQVYSEAKVTRAWLNHEVDPTSPALRALSRLIEMKHVKKGGMTANAYSRRDIILSYLGMAQRVESHDWGFWTPVTEILCNEYWSRVWIQQELLVSREVRFHIRQTEIPGKHIFRLHDILTVNWMDEIRMGFGHPYHKLRLGYTTYYGREKYQVIEARRKDSRRPLINLISYALDMEASNPLDVVYGCLALANQLEIRTLRVDYSLTLAQAYANVIRSHILHWKTLDFLLFNVLYPLEEHPTWLPTREQRPRFLISMDFRSPELDWLTTSSLVSDDGLRLLGVRAYPLDTIAHVSSVTDPPSASVSDILKAIIDCYVKIHPHAKGGEVWSSDSLIGVLKWKSPLVRSVPPFDGVDDILRDIVEFTKTSPQQTDFGFSATCNLLMQIPPAFGRSRYTTVRNLAKYLLRFVPVATEAGRLGFVGWTNPERKAHPGDKVWLVAGCSQPVILREQSPGGGQFSVIGPALFTEFMDIENTRVPNWFGDRISNGEALEDFTQRVTLI